MEYSGVKQEYLDPSTNEKFIPYIIESTYGLDRTILALLFEAYEEEQLENDTKRSLTSCILFLPHIKRQSCH